MKYGNVDFEIMVVKKSSTLTSRNSHTWLDGYKRSSCVSIRMHGGTCDISLQHLSQTVFMGQGRATHAGASYAELTPPEVAHHLGIDV